MRTKISSTIFFLFFFSLSAFAVQHFWRGETISASEAEKRWGSAPFDAEKFKSGNDKARASMAGAMLKNEKIFKGKDVAEIRAMLGGTSGFYFSDIYPTYLIQTGQTNREETWQIVFLLNNDRKVAALIIHKNCCD